MNRITRCAMLGGLLLMVGLTTVAEEDVSGGTASTPQRFRAADNVDGPGFFWVDTTSGQLWMVDVGTMTWKYCGAPMSAAPAAIGTFIPRKNQSGTGLYILNTVTGQGWWTDGVEWKELGVPTKPVHAESP